MNKHFSNTKYKMPAFTLPELVVSMLLMAILFGIIATVYSIVAKQAQAAYRVNSFFADYYSTKKVMETDFEKAATITITDDHKKIFLEGTPANPAAGTVTYTIDTNYIVRIKNESVDTLLPGAVISHIKRLSDSLPLVTEIKLQHVYNRQFLFTYLQKTYTASNLLSFYYKTQD